MYTVYTLLGNICTPLLCVFCLQGNFSLIFFNLFLCRTYISRLKVFKSTEEEKSSESTLKFSNYTISVCVNIGSREYSSRSTRRRCSVTISVLENFSKFKGNHLYQSLYFVKVAEIRDSGTAVFLQILRYF